MNFIQPTQQSTSEEELHKDRTAVFGFWVYLMTDFVLFASLFSVYVVLRAGQVLTPSATQIFSAPFVLTETLLLLTSSLICGLVLLAARAGKKHNVLVGLGVTLLLGASFLGMELYEFGNLIREGHTYHLNGFLSSYFTLVGTHGFHIFVGLIWGIVLAVVIALQGLTRFTMRKLVLWSLFWHFLDIVWIFIFTIVYLTSFI